jgi:hypothetical protein
MEGADQAAEVFTLGTLAQGAILEGRLKITPNVVSSASPLPEVLE